MRLPTLMLLVFSACSRGEAQESPRPAPVPAADVPATARRVLFGPTASAPLHVPGFAAAEHVVPAGATAARPIVVILHGNFDRPEWDCAAWTPILAGRAFVLCPRGIPRRDAPGLDRWEYGSKNATLREVAAAREALSARYPGFVDEGPDVWVGFSLGAYHVAARAMAEPARAPRILLVEGGFTHWTPGSIRRFARSGSRMAFACGRPGCRRQAELLSHALVRAGGAPVVGIAFAPIGHNFYGPLVTETRTVFDQLVAGDSRF